MATRTICFSIALAGLGLLAANANAQRIYCWTDDTGMTHCGDSVPPASARHDRQVRNEQGVTIATEEGEITAEEKAAIDQKREEEEQRQAAEAESQAYDRMLLAAYLTVEDIETLRDRRLELVDSQIKVTENSLTNLRAKLEELRRSEQRYAPHNEREGALPVPRNLLLDIERTESSILVREEALEDLHENQERIRLEFERDISRFRQLKGA
ncbi:MAG: DUF4124 domain-containing protein [Gammaproteobacteria bacterium]|jgi:hypothetical protein